MFGDQLCIVYACENGYCIQPSTYYFAAFDVNEL